MPGATFAGCTGVVVVIVGAFCTGTGVIWATGAFWVGACAVGVAGVSEAACGSRSFLQLQSTTAIERRLNKDFAFMAGFFIYEAQI
jgi:hypothetical protein